jgi:class 3 adenylate cyclase
LQNEIVTQALDYMKRQPKMEDVLKRAAKSPESLKEIIPVFQSFANYGDILPYQHYLNKVKKISKRWEGETDMAFIVPQMMEAYEHFCLAEYNQSETLIMDLYNRFELKQDTDHYAFAESLLGICKRDRGDIDAALIHCYNVTHALNKDNALANFRSYAFYFIAEIHMQINDPEEAGKNYKKALKIAKQVNHKAATFRALIGLGAWYQHQNKPKKCIRLYKQALDMKEMSETSQSRVLRDMGTYYFSQKKYDKSLRYLKMSYDLAMKCGYSNPASTCLINMGKVYLKIGKPRKSLGVLREALKISLDHQTRAKQMEIESMLATTYEALNEFDKAYRHSRKFQELWEVMNMAKQREIFKIKNRMIEDQKEMIKRERDRSDQLLLNILPKSIAQELKENNYVNPKRFERVTVLFADFVGFTTISEALSSKYLVKNLDNYFGSFDRIIMSCGLEKIKTIGDAYMCVGGLPDVSNTHARDVVGAALEMQKYVEERRADDSIPDSMKWKLRIGVHTGHVVAGVVGVNKFQYDIWGDTVNIASRMEGASESGMVNISESTYNHIKNDTRFVFKHRGKIEVKGKGPMDMWFVSLKGDH